MGEAIEMGSWLVTRSAFSSSDFIKGGSCPDSGGKGFTVPGQSGPLREESFPTYLTNTCCMPGVVLNIPGIVLGANHIPVNYLILITTM